MSKQWNLAIVGATGAVGNELLRVLEGRDFPVDELRLFASGRSEETFLEFRGEEILVEAVDPKSFAGIDLIFSAADRECSRQLSPLAAAGAVCIDLSSAWRLDPEVPLIVPEANARQMADYPTRRIIATPGGATTPLVVALQALHTAARIRRIVVATYQSVSGSGRQGIDELRLQAGELLNGRPAAGKVFPHQIAFNCLPQTDAFLEDGYTREEIGLIEETRRLLGGTDLQVTATTVRVPIFYGHAAAVNIETEKKLDVSRARELLAAAPGVRLIDEPADQLYPMPFDAAGQDLVLVGRLREDRSIANGLNLWLCADNLRISATNAVQIAELLVEKSL